LVWKHFKWLWAIVVFAGVGVVAQAVPPGNAEEVRARTTPVGQLCRTGMGCGGPTSTATSLGASGAMSGQQIYDQFCFVCHATGVTDAPRFANSEDWESRLAKGMEALMETTINGLNFMPVRGACMACSDGELQAAIDYMVETAR